MSTQQQAATNVVTNGHGRGPRVLIVGAGIAGLTLAQSLRRHGIPSTIFERDSASHVRSQGWGLSIHSTLITMEEHLLPEVYDLVCDARVDPSISRDDVRGVAFVNGATGKVEHEVPKSKRLRLRRDTVRAALMHDLDIQWGKRLVKIEETGSGVQVEFDDGTTASGDVLVGADGNSSIVRRYLAPENHEVTKLPINAMGVSLTMTEAQVAAFREKIDPLYFFGTHPETNVYTFWSLLETPQKPGGLYGAQLYFSWIESEKDEELFKIPLLDLFRQLGRQFFHEVRALVDGLPEDTLVTKVKLVDWPSVEWNNWHGRCTLIGDAAHCMVIYRGEGVNHAIVDACQLADTIKMAVDGQMSMRNAVNMYEERMRPRATEAVEISRQAGIDAHSYSKIDKEGSFALLGEKPV